MSLAAVVVAVLGVPAGPVPGSTQGQAAKGMAKGVPDLSVVELQVRLDRAGFSPGEIDGRPGANTERDPLAIADYGPLHTADGKRSFEIETLRPQGDFLVARFAGIADRNAAETLRNTELYVARDRFPDVDGDSEFYVADLVGLKARDRAGAALGEIVAVHNFGAGDLIELKLTDVRDTVLLAFSDAGRARGRSCGRYGDD